MAWAYLLRGDLKELKGDLNGARRDWLKVATFFRRQAELVKLANEKLGDEEGCLGSVKSSMKTLQEMKPSELTLRSRLKKGF